jgi:endonuclease YncB( thermonuclease family)
MIKRQLLLLSVIVLFSLLEVLAADLETFKGIVVKVRDGDSFTVKYRKVETEIRLHGIEAPEKGQPYSKKAKKFLSDLTYQKTVKVVPLRKDHYYRYDSEVFLPDGRRINEEIVKAGFAWWSSEYAPDDKKLESLQAEARKNKIGLWADPDPIPPWEWKKDPKPTGFFASRYSKCYHIYSCDNLSVIKPKNLKRYKTEDEAIKDGKKEPCKCCKTKSQLK